MQCHPLHKNAFQPIPSLISCTDVTRIKIHGERFSHARKVIMQVCSLPYLGMQAHFSKEWIVPCTSIVVPPTPRVISPERTWQKYLPTVGWVMGMYSVKLEWEVLSDLVAEWFELVVLHMNSTGPGGAGWIVHTSNIIESTRDGPSGITDTWYWAAMTNEDRRIVEWFILFHSITHSFSHSSICSFIHYIMNGQAWHGSNSCMHGQWCTYSGGRVVWEQD